MTEVQQYWEKTCVILKEKLGQITFETWILPLLAKSLNEKSLVLTAPDSFFRDWINKNFISQIESVFNETAKSSVGVTLEIGGNTATTPSIQLPVLPKEAILSNNLNPRYTFENFVVGPSNRHAHAYSLAVADSPAKLYNPLFVYGGVGLGKTHLIQAICHKIIENKAGVAAKIHYVSSEKFTNELIEAIQKRSTTNFRQKYRNVNILVLDDIHFIAGKDSTQEEFFHTFNTLYDAHKQIIICSDRPPKEIADLQARLVSRFSWGLTIDIQPPDLETRIAILKKKLERESVAIPDEVIVFIAQLIKTNIRELEGALIRTIAYSMFEEKPVTLESTKEVLKDLLKEPKKLITVDFIQRCVAEEYGLSLSDFKTKKRNKNLVLPRQIAMYLSRDLTDLSFPEIGHFFGGKDHTTVLYSYKKIKVGIGQNPHLSERINRVVQVIQS